MKKSFPTTISDLSIRPCHHIGLFVTHLEKITKFYVDRLGFAVIRDGLIDAALMKKIFGINSPGLMRYLALNGLGVELFFLPKMKMRKRGLKALGYDHWSLLVEDKDVFCRTLARKGVKVIKIPRPHGFTYFIKDPENNLIEIKSYQL